MSRPQADPLGMRGLPDRRDQLDRKADLLCVWLRGRGKTGLSGKSLASNLYLRDTRALCLLVAYARVHKHRHEIVGIPGQGYVWGDADSGTDASGGIYKRAIRDAKRRGRCYLFIASLHGRKGVAMAAAQMVFDFMSTEGDDGERHTDDLAAMLALDGSSVADSLDAFITKVASTDDGRAALRTVAEKHRDVLLPGEVLDGVLADLDQIRDKLGAARRTA